MIVSVDPPSGTIRYSVTKLVNSGIVTPIRQFFEKEYDFYNYVKHQKIDRLNFWEKYSFEMSPMNLNNLQIFEIEFGLHHKAIPLKQLMRSFNRQRKYVGKLIDVATKYSLHDSFGKKEINKRYEREGIAGTSLLYYQVRRIYTLPEYKMIVLRKPTETTSNVPLASLLVMYQPLYASPIPEANWVQHELVYEAKQGQFHFAGPWRSLKGD